MDLAAAVVGRSPGATFGATAKLAFLRALRTFIQGIAASFGTGAAASSILTASYWEAFGVSVLGALITAAVSFLQNVATFFPEDPTQQAPAPPVASGTGEAAATPAAG
jgi:hypothetical protein